MTSTDECQPMLPALNQLRSPKSCCYGGPWRSKHNIVKHSCQKIKRASQKKWHFAKLSAVLERTFHMTKEVGLWVLFVTGQNPSPCSIVLGRWRNAVSFTQHLRKYKISQSMTFRKLFWTHNNISDHRKRLAHTSSFWLNRTKVSIPFSWGAVIRPSQSN